MNLTRKQVKVLKYYEKWRGGKPPLSGFIIPSWPRYAYLFVVLGGAAVYLWISGQFFAATLTGGWMGGTLYADLQRYIVYRNFWPVTKEIMDWSKVRNLIEQQDPHT